MRAHSFSNMTQQRKMRAIGRTIKLQWKTYEDLPIQRYTTVNLQIGQSALVLTIEAAGDGSTRCYGLVSQH